MSSNPQPPSDGLAGPEWTELLAAAAILHRRALERVDFPALVITLPRRLIIAVNRACADLFALTAGEMEGHTVDDVVQLDDEAASLLSTSAMSEGSIDAYRALRHITGGDGVARDYAVWLRAIELDGVRYGVTILTPRGRGASEATSLPVHPLDPLVVGAAGSDWRVKRISADVREVCGSDAPEVIGESLLSHVHPDDLPALQRATAVALKAGAMTGLVQRMRFCGDDTPWMVVRLLVSPQRDAGHTGIAFALLPAEPAPVPRSSDRVAELEAGLRRIAQELRCAGVLDDTEQLPSATDHPELNELSSRQWQILVRLLRGERVPTIAEELYISPRTVRNHLSTIFSIFGVHSQAELIALLRRRG